MISHAATVGICVGDQDAALAFYTEKLGFELLQDTPMGDATAKRWLVVAPPGAQTHFVLMTPDGLEDRIGTFANLVFTADDVQATYEEYAAKGVEFIEPPNKQFWGGLMGQFKDNDGNVFVLHD